MRGDSDVKRATVSPRRSSVGFSPATPTRSRCARRFLSSSNKKRDDAARLGAHDFLPTSDEKALASAAGRFDFILDTVSAPHDLAVYARLLRRDGTMILVGARDDRRAGIARH